MLGNVVYDNVGVADNLPFAAAVAFVPVVVMVVYLRRGAPHRRPGQPVSASCRAPGPRSRCGVVMALGLAFVYVPLVVVLINSFNSSTHASAGRRPGSPSMVDARPSTTPGVRDALGTSVLVGLGRDGGRARPRARWPRSRVAAVRVLRPARPSASLLVLPIALPGIVTGIALNTAFSGRPRARSGCSRWSSAHATFCIVVVYNNVLARLRRHGHEPRGGLHGPRRRHVHDVPAGHVPAAALGAARRRRCWPSRCSFDEIVVTTFTAGRAADAADLDLREPVPAEPAPVVNVVAAVLILLSILPIWAAQRLSGNRSAAGSDRAFRQGSLRMSPIVELRRRRRVPRVTSRDMC